MIFMVLHSQFNILYYLYIPYCNSLDSPHTVNIFKIIKFQLGKYFPFTRSLSLCPLHSIPFSHANINYSLGWDVHILDIILQKVFNKAPLETLNRSSNLSFGNMSTGISFLALFQANKQILTLTNQAEQKHPRHNKISGLIFQKVQK